MTEPKLVSRRLSKIWYVHQKNKCLIDNYVGNFDQRDKHLVQSGVGAKALPPVGHIIATCTYLCGD